MNFLWGRTFFRIFATHVLLNRRPLEKELRFDKTFFVDK